MTVQGPDMGGGDEKARLAWQTISRLIFTAADNDVGAQFFGFAVGVGLDLRRRKKNGGDEQKETEDGGEPALPEAEGQYNQRRTETPQGYTKECP